MPRVNITVSEPLHSYYLTESENAGIPMSALMTSVLYAHMKNQDRADFNSNIKELSSLIEALREMMVQSQKNYTPTRGTQKSTKANQGRGR